MGESTTVLVGKVGKWLMISAIVGRAKVRNNCMIRSENLKGRVEMGQSLKIKTRILCFKAVVEWRDSCRFLSL